MINEFGGMIEGLFEGRYLDDGDRAPECRRCRR